MTEEKICDLKQDRTFEQCFEKHNYVNARGDTACDGVRIILLNGSCSIRIRSFTEFVTLEENEPFIFFWPFNALRYKREGNIIKCITPQFD